MNVLRCFHLKDGGDEIFEKWVGDNGYECSRVPEGFPGDFCIFLEYGWALGGELAVNPPEIGFPFYSRQYYQLEVHVHNPELLPNEEIEVGFRIYYTPERQPVQGKLLMVAQPSNYLLMVPPNTSNFTAVAHCMPRCLGNGVIPPEGITIYNAFLHAHTSARKMIIRHYRDGKELPWIINDENYDFNYQTNRRLPKEVKVYPGDQITAECIYDTHWKDGKGVIGGSSTEDEMCMVFMAYYPAIDLLEGCYDWMNKFNMYKVLGIETVDDPLGKNPRVTSPAHLAGKRFSEVVDELEWTDAQREEYAWQHHYGEHITACITPRVGITPGYYPMTDKPYEEESQCTPSQDPSTTTITTQSTTTTPGDGSTQTSPTTQKNGSTIQSVGTSLYTVLFLNILLKYWF